MATSITLTTNNASTEYTLATGGRGPAGAAGTALTAGTGIDITAGVVSSTVTGNATHTGDATGSTALTLATVNSNIGSFTNASLTVNAKGLVTAASSGTTPIATITGTANQITVASFANGRTLSLASPINVSTTGNAATVTTNANLTGHITSVGNAASLGSFTLAQLDTATSDATLARTDAGQTFAGLNQFSTRPQSSAALTPENTTELITLADFNTRITDPSILYLRDDFVMGSQNVSDNIGELGWSQYGTGTGKGITPGPVASPSSNPGQRVLTSGNADTNGQTIYWSGDKLYPAARTAWQMIWVFKVNQTTLCDVIAGMTSDSAAIGIAKFGGISVGVRYSSATDTDFMFYSKNTTTTFAANDANNFAVTSGLAVDTNFHTVRMRSTTLAAIEMSIDGGAWVAVTYTPSSAAAMIPFFYIATRTAATKAATVDYFSFYETSLPR